MQPLIDYLLVLQVAEFCINWSRTPSFAAHIKKKLWGSGFQVAYGSSGYFEKFTRKALQCTP